MWMCLPELNIGRSNASGAIILDHLYVFGGKGDKGYVKQIERLYLKNTAAKFEIIDIQLPNQGASDIGIISLGVQNSSCAEIMLIGGFNGQSVSNRFRFTASIGCNVFNDNS